MIKKNFIVLPYYKKDIPKEFDKLEDAIEFAGTKRSVKHYTTHVGFNRKIGKKELNVNIQL